MIRGVDLIDARSSGEARHAQAGATEDPHLDVLVARERGKIRANRLLRAAREVSIDALPEGDGVDGIEALLRNNGDYVHMPRAWRDPEEFLTDQRFCDVLEAGMARLSANAGRAFLLRELMGLCVAEICKELQVSTTNCHILLHRARLWLRAYLDERWFAAERAPSAG